MTQKQKIAYQRSFIVKDYLASGLGLKGYCQLRNNKLELGLLESTELKKSISAATLCRWVAAYKDGQTKALEPGYRQARGQGATLSKPEKALLQKYWLHQNRPSVAAVCAMIAEYNNINISYHIARRYLKQLPEALKILRRLGPTAYKDKVENYISKNYERLEVMQQVCADHHTLDLKCVEKLGDKPFRPYLTAFIDMRSRKLLAWAINKNSPDQWTVMQVLEQLVRQHGVPQSVLIDNGKDFTAKTLTGSKVQVQCIFDTDVEIEIKGVFAELGCAIVRSTPYHGQAKQIERFFSIVCERFSKQYDTYCGSNTVTRPEEAQLFHRSIHKQAKRNVMLTLEELRRGFQSWEAWYNQQHRQKGLNNCTAEEIWQLRKARIDMPTKDLEQVFCRAEIKQFRRAGVRIEGIDYYNPELAAELFGSKVLVKRPFNDISKCFLYDLNGQFLGQALSRAELGLEDSGITEQNLAHKKHLNKRLKTATKAYEEALGQVKHKTIQDAHRQPMHQKFRKMTVILAEDIGEDKNAKNMVRNPIDNFLEEQE